MPVEVTRGDIFASGAMALVSPVNTTGVQGKGLALEFRRRFPDECRSFRTWCLKHGMSPGDVWTHPAARRPRLMFAATKDDWRQPSRLEWVARAMAGIRAEVERLGLESVAVCALGCGLGGLRWADVRRVMLAEAERMSALVLIYEPGGDVMPFNPSNFWRTVAKDITRIEESTARMAAELKLVSEQLDVLVPNDIGCADMRRSRFGHDAGRDGDGFTRPCTCRHIVDLLPEHVGGYRSSPMPQPALPVSGWQTVLAWCRRLLRGPLR